MSVDTSSTSFSFSMVFVAVSLVEVLASVSSRIIVSSVAISCVISSWVSENNTVVSQTLSVFAILWDVFPLNITDLIAFALTACTLRIYASSFEKL